ncbi:hypothetical protein CKF54_03720 [Psittacicella hinzii]|uniref:Uncharacterized protein n=1 Tax=Psittacicella hinzii TaxID=2028575 RepID=A0A3A1Y6K9_9GAMM|nr:hypothetical protein [Psittacicella hinzii]RIY32920.1 hypothetical protein CKF54_03720 [Psittacicella hinzii]
MSISQLSAFQLSKEELKQFEEQMVGLRYFFNNDINNAVLLKCFNNLYASLKKHKAPSVALFSETKIMVLRSDMLLEKLIECYDSEWCRGKSTYKLSQSKLINAIFKIYDHDLNYLEDINSTLVGRAAQDIIWKFEDKIRDWFRGTLATVGLDLEYYNDALEYIEDLNKVKDDSFDLYSIYNPMIFYFRIETIKSVLEKESY